MHVCNLVGPYAFFLNFAVVVAVPYSVEAVPYVFFEYCSTGGFAICNYIIFVCNSLPKLCRQSFRILPYWGCAICIFEVCSNGDWCILYFLFVTP